MQFAISTRQLASELGLVAFLFSTHTGISTHQFNVSVMAKATTKKQNNRADPLSKKGKEARTEKEVKTKSPKKEKDSTLSNLYTDDNPETTLQGTGFKDAATANKTSK